MTVKTSELEALHFSDAPKIVTRPPGPRARELLDAQEKLEGNAYKYPRAVPWVPEEGRGATVRDVDGNIFLDFFSGIGVLNVGHAHPEVLEAVRAQEAKLVHALDFPVLPRIELIRTLRAIAPGELHESCRVVFGGPTGSDAVEAAIKLAKLVTGRHTLIAFQGSYHGQTAGALAVTAGRPFKQSYLPLIPDVHFVPYPYPYRPSFGASPERCGTLCVEYLDDLLTNPYSGVGKPAAILVEPIQGEGGIVVPPNDFLPALRELARYHDIPLIVDEIQTGLGRTGAMFACEHVGVTPDILTLGKALGGIGLPLSACLYDERLDRWPPGGHLGTFRGHASAMVAGRVAIEILQRDRLVEHAARLGAQLLERLQALQERVPQLGDVRGRGLFIGLELVKDPRTKEPAPELTAAVQRRCYEEGVLIWTAGRYNNVLRIMPPLTISETLAHRGLDVVERVIEELA